MIFYRVMFQIWYHLKMFLSLTLKYLAARKLLQNILYLLGTLNDALQIHAKKTDILHFIWEKNAGNLNSPTDV